MENRLKILEPIIVITKCVDGTLARYSDYYYCGNKLLAYHNRDAYRYPQENNLYECFGMFRNKAYYIPRKYVESFETTHIRFKSGYRLEDFEEDKVIDEDTFETSYLNAEGYDWYETLKRQTESYLKRLKKF